MRGVEHDHSQRVAWRSDGGCRWRRGLLWRLWWSLGRRLWGRLRCGLGYGWLRGLLWCLRRGGLRRRLQSSHTAKNQNQEKEEESSAAHSHEDTRIDALKESYTPEIQLGDASR